MILDSLTQAKHYFSLNKHFEKAFKFLMHTDLNNLPLGRTDIDGNNVYAAVSEYSTKSPEEAKWEAHKKYIDIQFLAKGKEYIGYAPLKTCTEKDPYNPDKDIVILNAPDQIDFVSIHEDVFAVFFPNDAHQPGVTYQAVDMVRKVVVKVLAD